MSRHKIAGRKFNRNSSSRKALMRALACALIREESIKTTLAKAKSLRQVVEPLITQAESNDLNVQRRLFSALRDKALVHKLVTTLGPRFKSRPGGYCRIVKCGFRAGDDAPMAIIQLVE
ncbi:MAG: 50S ribosomal protein L17 [Legionellales bacterium]|nr:50S ribosomal protein L17 [Legionellales bacterium]